MTSYEAYIEKFGNNDKECKIFEGEKLIKGIIHPVSNEKGFIFSSKEMLRDRDKEIYMNIKVPYDCPTGEYEMIVKMVRKKL